MVSHGTLLFNSDLSHVSEALNVQGSKITSKGIKSVHSRVANISEFLAQLMDVETFHAYLLTQIFARSDTIPEYPVSTEDWVAVRQLADERYRSWEWTYGHSPDFNVEKRQRFPGGEIDARLDIQQGVIRSVKFYGDVFAELDLDALERRLMDVRYRHEDITLSLQDVPIERYFSGLDLDTFIDFLF